MTNDLTTSSCAIAAYLDSGHYDPSIQFKQGRYHTGKIEVPIGSSFLALVPEHKIGWQSWADRMPGRSVMGYLHQGYEPPRAKRSAISTRVAGSATPSENRAIHGSDQNSSRS